MNVETLELGWDLYVLHNKPKEELDRIFEDWEDGPAPMPMAIIPPYDLKSEQNTAIMADTIKRWYPDKTVGIVMPNVPPARICQLIKAFRQGGFSPIVFNGGLPLPTLARLKLYLHKDQWYHVTDPKFEIPFAGVKGRWTRSENL